MKQTEELKMLANKMRRLTIKSVYYAQSGHPGGSLSICDILAVLFFDHMNIQADRPEDENRDRFVLSKGHAAPAYYAALAMKGFFEEKELEKLRNINSFLQGHPCRGKVPGVDMSTGSLGQGLSAANGMALAGKYDKAEYRVYCICGDGELQEGQIWEAAMTAAHYRLDNLTLFVDANGLQIDGAVAHVMDIGDIGGKFSAFGWNVITADGHSVEELDWAVTEAKKYKRKPTVIICRTVKGKGVSFMENQVGWHGTAPGREQYEQAIKELEEGGI